MNRYHNAVDALLYNVSGVMLDDYIIEIDRCVNNFDYDSFSFVSLNRKIEYIANNLAKKEKQKSVYTKRIAAIIIAIILAITLAMSVEAVREYVINFFMEIYDKYSVAQYAGEEDNHIMNNIYFDKIDEYYRPAYIPEGYFMVSEKKNDNVYMIIYENESGSKLIYKQTCYDYIYTLDNEHMNIKHILCGDVTVHLFENDERKIALWYNKGYNYTISGDVSEDDIINIIQKLELL